MSDQRKVPTGRLARLTNMARVGVRTGMSVLGGGEGSGAAEQAAALLGNLRGIAAKVGQMASYVDGMIPEPQRAAYERVLSSLQTATASSPFAEVQALLEAELGRSLVQAFAEFEPEPIASASIGQVHRARLHDGRAVAVKVQHPGIEQAIEADLKSAGSLTSVISLLGPRTMNPESVFEEVVERFREELDYEHEAAQQAAFAEMHRDDPRIHVPAVIASHSSKRVLCSELATGHSFSEAIAAEPSLRRSYAELLWHFVFKGVLQHGRFNADPHPGNFLFYPDGRITFLDYGCIQVLAPHQLQSARQMHGSTVAGDEAAFRRAAAVISETKPGPYETELLGYLWRCYEPLKHRPFHMTSEYVSGVVRGIQDLKGHMLRKTSNVTPIPRGLVFTNRLQFGFYSVLARFDVPADYAGITRALLESPALTQKL
jgi:predicted unusual protein kinase regulating ubiquinone biosynthesis (AarF/ABC1/UbiB family)